MLFDCYRRHPIKAPTRSRRSTNTARPVRRVIEVRGLREIPLPMKWKKILAIGDNRADLAQFLSDEIIPQAPAPRRIWRLLKRSGCSLLGS